MPIQAKAQYPNDKEVFFDSLKTYWSDKNKSDKAVDWAIAYKNKWPNSFNNRIEKALLPVLKSSRNVQAESMFLEQLFLKKDSTINAYVGPIYYWNKILHANNEKDLDNLVDQFNRLLKDSANYLNRTERYGLAIVKLLEAKNYNQTKTNRLLAKLISNLEKFKYMDRTDAPEGSMLSWQRHWFRCLYSYTYFQTYLKNPNSEPDIEKAAYFSPDFLDKPFEHEIQKELNFLFNDSTVPNFKIEYFTFLQKNNKKIKALDYLTHVTLGDPSNENHLLLKQFYPEIKKTDPFEVYWKKKIDSVMVPFPKVSLAFTSGQTVHFGTPSKKWIYIDVWGTWCPPCLKELPEIEKFYQQCKNNPLCQLEVFTLSFNSTNLQNFLMNKNFTFPVSEITEDITKKLKITSYPAKFLLSPEGNYLQLPHGNWKEYIKNYTLMPME